MAADEILELN